MDIISFLGGGVLGSLLTIIIVGFRIKNMKIDGVIDVDAPNNLCQVHIISTELSDPKVKTAVFMVNHNANLSREEQIL